MKANTKEKSCSVQLSIKMPTADWTLKQLGEWATDQHRAISENETAATVLYWRLGLALELIRQKFEQGKWTAHLQSLGIDKTRACRACAIHATFASEAELAGLSVHQDHAQRQPPRTKEKTRKSRGRGANFIRAYMGDLERGLKACGRQVRRARLGELRGILSSLTKVKAEFIKLDNELGRRLAASQIGPAMSVTMPTTGSAK